MTRAPFSSVLVLSVCLASAATAQRAPEARTAVSPRAGEGRQPAVPVGSSVASLLRAIPRSAAPVASLILPGLGQAALDRDRAIAYLAVETFSVLQYLKESREHTRERRQYRTLARDVARSSFQGEKPDGSWAYYEAMEHFLESGEFSLSLSEVVPEQDTLTYNGSRWILARRTFWANPFVAPAPGSQSHQAAIDFYLEKAVRPEFRWTWRNAQLQRDLYRRSIDRANDSARRSRAAVTLIVANHLLSAIDAFALVRLDQAGGPGRSSIHRLRVSLPVGR